MTTMSYAREADRLTGDEAAKSARPLDLSAMTGDWISQTGLGGGVAWFRPRACDDGSLAVSASGYGEPRPGEWGEVPADAFANALQSREGMAFMATFDGPAVSSTLESYQALGVQTGHTFHRFTDGSGLRDYFTREFYVLAAAGRKPEPCGDFPEALRSGRNDPSGLLGTWTCLAPDATKSVATLECDLVDGEFTVRADGVGADGPVDWGTTRAEIYADAAFPYSPPAFLATFDHGYMRVHLQARINRGVLVVCEFTKFTDGSGRSDYFIRECYRR